MKVYYASPENKSMNPPSLEVLIIDTSVFVRESELKRINGLTAIYKGAWKISTMSILTIKGKPANMAFKTDGGYYNRINFRGRELDRITDEKKLSRTGPRGFDDNGIKVS